MANPARFLAALWLSLFLIATPAAADEKLSIDPVFQETPVWCWAAVGEMVFRHYDVPNINPVGDYQCGIASQMLPSCEYSCANCVSSAGSLIYMNNVLIRYPKIAQFRTGIPTGTISSSPVYRALTRAEIEEEIDNGRPIVAGISPTGFPAGGTSQHVALIIGYEEDDDQFILIVNDPFPYGHPAFRGQGDPFLKAGGEKVEEGQYRIRFDRFKTRLLWRESIYRIRCKGDACPS
jgi:hypothetical protein